MRKRIVITGIGVLSPIGSGRHEFWDALVSGKIGTSEITAFDTSIFKVNRGGEIKNFKPEDYYSSSHFKKAGRTTQLAVAGCKNGVSRCRIGACRIPS